MSIYESHKKVPGANKEERLLLKTLKGVDFLSFIKKCNDEDITTKYMYMKFIAGEEVPEFVRSQIMQFVREKSQKLRKIGKESG